MAFFLLCWSLGTSAQPAATPTDDGMVLVPAGPFTMGSEGKAIDEDAAERPVHSVEVAAFRIDRNEVTTRQYCEFLNQTRATQDAQGRAYLGSAPYLPIELKAGSWQPRAGREAFPMTNVTWYGATAYATWVGKRLPTEAEWEKAARGTDGRKFPWGNEMDYGKMVFGQDAIGPVGAKPAGASPYGCLDLAGNAWEWTSSAFRPYPYVATDGREASDLPERRVPRGGSWTGEPHIAHAAYRFRPFPDFAHAYLGFRCAVSVE
jgi:formylglycine-generating enzyme required for sulfatase activity